MKQPLVSCLTAAWVLAATARGQQLPPGERPPPPPPPVPVPIYLAPATTPAVVRDTTAGTREKAVYVYDQKPLGLPPMLIAPDQAQAIVERFRTNYARLESPRVLLYINRPLVDEQSGVKVAGGTATTTSTTGVDAGSAAGQTVVQQALVARDAFAPSLADREMLRDVERLFGRPFRLAGVALVDQAVATQLLHNRPLKELLALNEGAPAVKDREAIAKLADVVIEILVSSHQVNAAEASGDHTYTLPDVLATAIRLKDSKVIGQATAAEVLLGHAPGVAARYFTPPDITEATALALMEDIAQTLTPRN